MGIVWAFGLGLDQGLCLGRRAQEWLGLLAEAFRQGFRIWGLRPEGLGLRVPGFGDQDLRRCMSKLWLPRGRVSVYLKDHADCRHETSHGVFVGNLQPK